jgi:hypothetical protein
MPAPGQVCLGRGVATVDLVTDDVRSISEDAFTSKLH